MKKKVVMILAVVLCIALCMALTACGSNGASQSTSVEGTKWAVSSVTDADGNETTGDDIAAVVGDITYEFQGDGVLAVTAAGQTVEGTWSQDGNKITIEANGETSEGALDGDALTFEVNGATTVFTKA